jgi:aspartate carbamoyltransferase regulatory subunit
MPRDSTEPYRVQSDAYAEYVKNMKHYEVIDLEGEWGVLRCPKSDCKGEFKVKRKQFKESKESIGRSCPYCFRTSAKPEEEITAEGLNRGKVAR